MNKNTIENILSGALAIIILAIVEDATGYVTGYLSSIKQIAISAGIWVWKIITQTYTAPGWVWLLILIMAVMGLLFLYQVIIKPFIKVTPKWVNYTHDQIGEILWRWSWNNNEIVDLTPFCPRCDGQLVYSIRADYYGEGGITTLECEKCPRNLEELEVPAYTDVISKKKREIQRRIRTGDYS